MLNSLSEKNKIINGPNIYYFALVYRIFLSFIILTNFTPTISPNFLNRLSYLGIVLLLVKIYGFDHNNIRQLIWKSSLILLAIISWRLSKAVDILFFVLFIVGAQDVDYRNIIRLFFGTVVILLTYTILVSQIGVIKDAIYTREGFDRHSLGVNYPTDLAAYFFYVVLAYWCLYFKRATWRSSLVILILSVILYSLTEARTDTVLIIMTIPVIWIAKRAFENHTFARILASLYWMAPAILSYCVVFISYMYDSSNHVLSRLNRIVSDRLVLSKNALDKYGMSLLGQRVHEHGYGGAKGHWIFYHAGSEYFYIDSSFIRLVVIYGLIIGIIIVAIMTIVAFQSIKKRDYCLAAIIFLISIHCIIEQHLLDVSFDPFMFALLANNVYSSNQDYRQNLEVQRDE